MDIKNLLMQSIANAAQKAMTEGVFQIETLPGIILEVPPKKEFGDFATNFAMQSAKTAKMNPRKIAEAIIERMSEPWLEKTEIAGPGFINFYLKANIIYDQLASMIAAGRDYGNLPKKAAAKIQVEYVSANPTGPLHVGHGRGAAAGSRCPAAREPASRRSPCPRHRTTARRA